MKLIIDAETDGLLKDVTTAWIIGWLDIDTGKTSYWLDGDLGWQKELNKAEVVIGHNIIGFDLAVFEKLFNYRLPRNIRVRDTMIMSKVQNYRRFGMDGHSLERWGEQLHCPKGEYSEWKPAEDETKLQFWKRKGEDMLTYWKQDLVVTDKVHSTLMTEYRSLLKVNDKITTYLKAENAAAEWCARAEIHGWPFDVENAKLLFDRMEIELNAVRVKLMPLLGKKVVAIDKKNGEYPYKTPKWVKSGAYALSVANWFGINEFSGQDEDRLVEGPYSRVEIKDLDLDSVQDVKIFLFRHGWEPTEWNTRTEPHPTKKNRFIKVNTTPKITEDSLDCMEGDGKLYCDFLTTKSRYGILKTWLEEVDENGNLHGTCFPIGTPSMRATHKIIVNVPSGEQNKDGTPVSPWGKEMRSLFRCKPGWKLIGCDSSGNQARGLAHYLKSPEFTHQLLNGDIHQYNADVLTKVLADMGVTHIVPRPRAKRILYAFLFGAAGEKLWSYVFDKFDAKGKKLKSGFTKAVPGFQTLLDKLEAVYAKTKQSGNGYIPGIAGNRIYCDSFHKLLVYLLQAAEKATCSAAAMLTIQGLEENNIPYFPLIFMHDELDYMVPEEHAGRAAEIGKLAFRDGPKLFGVEIMDGSGKIGDNWYEVH